MAVDVKNIAPETLCSDAQKYSIGVHYGLDCGSNLKDLRASFNINWVSSLRKKAKKHIDLVRQYVSQKDIELCTKEISCEKPKPGAVVDPGNCEDSCIYVEVK